MNLWGCVIKKLTKFLIFRNLGGYLYVYTEKNKKLTAAWNIKELNCSGLCFIFYTITKIYGGADLIIFQHNTKMEV